MDDEDTRPDEDARSSSRWPLWLAAALAMLAGGTAAFYTTRPLYRAYGLIQLVPPGGPQWGRGVDPDYTAGEAALMRSAPLLNQAIKQQAWTALGGPSDAAARYRFEDRLSVSPQPGGMIGVYFTDQDPAAAQAGVEAAVKAYDRFTWERWAGSDFRKLTALASRKIELENRIRQIDEKLVEEPSADHARDASARAKLEQRRAETVKTQADVARGEEELKMEIRTRGRSQVISAGERPLRPWIDRRPMSAAWGAIGGFAVYAAVLGLWRAWRGRRRIVNPRTAFPVIVPEVRDVKPIAATSS